MTKKLLPILFTLLSVSLFAQKASHTDSLLLAAAQVVQQNDTLRVPVMVENPLLYSQNYIYKKRLDSVQRIVPLTYNEFVQNYIDIYTKRKDMFGKMLGLSAYYFPMFEKALKDYNIPAEIKYLSIIESSLNPHAVSRVGATGLWQFMFSTAKAYGLKMDNFVDERKDPIQASVAAATYFRDAYAELGDWLLAIAAYNCGKGNVTRAMAKAGSKDFWEIRPYLPLETRNYVPAFIAAVYVMNHYGKHQIVPQEPNMLLKTELIEVSRFVSLPLLAQALNVDEESLCELNPWYKKKIVNGTQDSPKRIVIPKQTQADYTRIYDVLNNTDLDVDMQVIAASNDDKRFTKKKSAVVYHKVKLGENLTEIANQYAIEVQDLKVWNDLKDVTVVPGQNLKIYAKTVKQHFAKKPSNKFLTYKVKAGDTLSTIADKFEGVTVQSIKRDNNLSKSVLQTGMVLKIVKG